jgi:hypothetical protein
MRLPLLAVLVYCTGCAPEARPATVAVPSGSEAADSSFSDAEKESIRQQVRENWIVDVGMDGLETMAAQIDVEINPDGAVQSAKIDPAGDNGNPNWRQFATACVRAVLKSSPLRMPADKPYAAWKHITLRFDARDLVGE